MAVFREGDRVEICSVEDGFRGSYYEATILGLERLDDGFLLYEIQYKNLLENDESGPLIDFALEREVRPLPPTIEPAPGMGFLCGEKVDAFDNDGWWVGTVIGKRGPDYLVYFETYKEKKLCPFSELRTHQEWVKEGWLLCPLKPV